MADVAVVSLGLDASGVKTGADQTNKALDSVQAKMDAAEKKIAELQKRLTAGGQSAAQAGKGFQDFGSALTSIGGPIGNFANQVTSSVAKVESLTSAVGLGGAAALGAVAGFVALAGSMAALTIAGSKVADELGDIAESTGFSVEGLQKLEVAAGLSGEGLGGVEKAVKTFAAALVEGRDKSSEAGKALARFGLDAKSAGEDVEGSFFKAALKLKEVRETVDGVVASNVLFGKGVNSLVRDEDNLNIALSQTTDKLAEQGLTFSKFAFDQAIKVDTSINRLSHSFETFKVVLSGVDGGVLSAIFDDIAASIEFVNGKLNAFGRDIDTLFRLPAFSVIGGVQFGGDFAGIGRTGSATSKSGGGGGGGAGGAAKTAAAAIRIDPAIAAQERENATARKTAADALIKDLENLDEAVRKAIVDELTFTPLDINKILASLPVSIPPGVASDINTTIRDTTVATQKGHNFFTEDDIARLDEQFASIFDGFFVSIFTAQKTVGAAFKDFALGIVDTFAQEFAKSLREAFLTPLIKQLTNFLTEGINSVFSGISGKGAAGLFKGAAKFFGGLFAEGGTLNPGQFGIVGERGPELAFAGSRPLQIAPMSGGGGSGSTFNINIGINAPAGTVDRRTTDQIAATVLTAVRRAQRNEGSR